MGRCKAKQPRTKPIAEKSVEPMPDGALFLRCAGCDHQVSAFLVFRNAVLLAGSRRPMVSEIEAIVPRLKCSQCGAKSVALE
jgi:hypothetical protein